MIAADLLCVVKRPGEVAQITRLAVGDERHIIGDLTEHRPFNMIGTQQVAFDENFVAKKLAPNILHPMYRTYCELCGPVVILGVDRDGEPRSLEQREAEQVVAKLDELSIAREAGRGAVEVREHRSGREGPWPRGERGR